MRPEDFMESFLQFEHKYKMFKKKVKGVYIWHYIRFNMFYEILKVYGVDGVLVNHSPIKYSEFKKNKLWEKMITYNQFFAHHKEVLIVSHERKYYDKKGNARCIYTDLLSKYLSNTYYILDSKNTENEYIIQKNHNIIYQNIEIFKQVKRLQYTFEMVSTSELDSAIIIPLETYFNLKLDVKFKNKISNLINHYLNNRKYLIQYYNYILKRIEPKIVILVVSYSFEKMVLCELAKERKIPVIELQHGMIGPMHIAYNFYSKINLPSFPDYLFTFGQFERDKAKFPISKEHIISVGYPELENKSKIYNKIKQTKKIILFISQTLEIIAEYANIAAQNLDEKKYHIIFQLHPKEYSDWKLRLGAYLNHPNIEVRGDYKQTVHGSLAQADWVVGNFSTVLYEAQMYDVKVAILKVGLYKNMQYLYNCGKALLVDSPEYLIEQIKEDSFHPDKKISIFERNSLNNIQMNINKIMRK